MCVCVCAHIKSYKYIYSILLILYWGWNINQLPVCYKLKHVKTPHIHCRNNIYMTSSIFYAYHPEIIYTKSYNSSFKAVSASSSGLPQPRRNELQHGTFLRFGHPRLIFSVRLLATSTKICTIGSSKVSHENLFLAVKQYI